MQMSPFARRRLVTCLFVLLGIALVWFALGGTAFAEDAAPPACGGKILEKCTPNSGDTAWMLTSVALVLMMTVPGVRREKAALSSGCKSHPANAPAGSSRSSYGGDEIAEAFGMRVTNW